MRYLSGPPEKSMLVIDDYLSTRLSMLQGKDKAALLLEFKEWMLTEGENDIWSIPDLTDEGLCDFFKRAITKK